MLRLSNATLASLPKQIIRPHYDRNQLESGIVHFGIGNFHRAHQAVYTDDVLSRGDLRWGITGISLRRPDIRDALEPQDGLYTLGTQSDKGTDWRVIGAIKNIIFAPHNDRAILNAVTSPTTRIISLTVTEKAYCLDPKSGMLDEAHPDIVHDLANPAQPRSVVGYLTAGLARRHHQRMPLPPVLSCDNLTSNGKKLRAALIRFAELQNPDLAKIFADQLVCPSTMVDRIVPQTTDHDRHITAQMLAVEDAWPVMTEPFTQWVIEDVFPLGRPDWDLSSAEFVRDVTPYERMKLSLLNASHTALAILGLLAGHQTVAAAMNDQVIAKFVEDFMREDIAPVLALPANMNVPAYIEALLLRFQNPALHHKLLQIASDSSQKIPQRFIPSILERLTNGLPLGRFAFALAGFLLLLEKGTEDTGLNFQDPQRDAMIASLRQAGFDDPDKILALLNHQAIFGNLRDHQNAKSEITEALMDIRRHGVTAALQRA